MVWFGETRYGMRPPTLNGLSPLFRPALSLSHLVRLLALFRRSRWFRALLFMAPFSVGGPIPYLYPLFPIFRPFHLFPPDQPNCPRYWRSTASGSAAIGGYAEAIGSANIQAQYLARPITSPQTPRAVTITENTRSLSPRRSWGSSFLEGIYGANRAAPLSQIRNRLNFR